MMKKFLLTLFALSALLVGAAYAGSGVNEKDVQIQQLYIANQLLLEQHEELKAATAKLYSAYLDSMSTPCNTNRN